MPFKSKSQMKACYAEKARNPKSDWNCKEFQDKTKNAKDLPEHTKKKKK